MESGKNNNYKWGIIAIVVMLVAIIVCTWYMMPPSQQLATVQIPDTPVADSDTIAKDIADETSEDEVIMQFITDMYNQAKYTNDEFLYKHCTEKLIQKLKADYDFDGDGLASWEFRTMSQDDNPEAPDKNMVVDVTPDGNGWYTYTFYDGGWKGKNRIKASVVNGTVLMDEVERIYDEYLENL